MLQFGEFKEVIEDVAVSVKGVEIYYVHLLTLLSYIYLYFCLSRKYECDTHITD